MSWNRQDSKKEEKKRKHSGGRFRVPLVLLVPLVLVVLAVGVWWAVRGGGHAERVTPDREGRAPSRPIAEAKPAPAPRPTHAEQKPEPTKEEKRLAEIRRYEERYGTNMPPGIKARVYFLKNPPKTVYTIENKFSFLRHPAERDIASLMMVEPGAFMLDKLEFGESFNRDFLASVLDKDCEPTDEDDAETRAVKEAVGALKREIVDIQRKEGKLPSEIMNEHAAMLYELGQLENDLEKELVKARNDPEMSDQDVEDLFVAANRMRKERGLPEWKVPDFSKRSIRLQRKLSNMKRRERK